MPRAAWRSARRCPPKRFCAASTGSAAIPRAQALRQLRDAGPDHAPAARRQHRRRDAGAFGVQPGARLGRGSAALRHRNPFSSFNTAREHSRRGGGPRGARVPARPGVDQAFRACACAPRRGHAGVPAQRLPQHRPRRTREAAAALFRRDLSAGGEGARRAHLLDRASHRGHAARREPRHERLRAKAGAPALRVRRYYYDANERLLELSDSLHAAERFAYEMRLSRP